MAALSFTTQDATPPEFGGKWATEGNPLIVRIGVS